MKKGTFIVLLAAATTVGLATCAGVTENNAGRKTGETSAGQGVSGETAGNEAALKETSGGNTPEQATSGEKTSGGNAPEQSVIKQNCGTGGNVLLTIAGKKGYLKDEGITIEYVETNANADTMTLLATDKVDVIPSAGISNPLQQIAFGVDLTVFGGHMIEGCMSVMARAGTEWNEVEPFIGKKMAVGPSYLAFTGAMMDLGCNNPLETVDWGIYSDYNDALATIIRGDIEYALMGTGQSLTVQEMAENEEIDIVSCQSEIMGNYSCCRMEDQTQWVRDNPNTVKAVIRTLLWAQSYYESNKEEVVKLYAAKTKVTEEYVVVCMLDDEHYFVSVDPPRNSVKRAWDIFDKTGFLDEEVEEANINDHINAKLYEEALGEAAKAYGKEVPEFYQNMKTFFEGNDK